jgi:hypothetical protein
VRQALAQCAHGLGRERRGAADEVSERREVEVLDRAREQRLDHRGDDRARLQPVLGGQRQEREGVEPAEQRGDVRLARVQPDHGDEHPVGVRERQRDEAPVDAGDVARLVPGLAGAPQHLVREHHALRAPGRSARVHERGEVVVGAGDDRSGLGLLELRGRQLPLARFAGGHDPLERVDALARLSHHDRKVGRRDHRARPGVGEQVP